MDKEKWDALPLTEQDRLSSKYGVTRSGINNQDVSPEELVKIPEPKLIKEEDEKPKKKTRKSIVKKVSKSLSGRRVIAKSKSRKK